MAVPSVDVTASHYSWDETLDVVVDPAVDAKISTSAECGNRLAPAGISVPDGFASGVGIQVHIQWEDEEVWEELMEIGGDGSAVWSRTPGTPTAGMNRFIPLPLTSAYAVQKIRVRTSSDLGEETTFKIRCKAVAP